MICLNCVADINTATIGQSGGCNPIPLKARVDGGRVVVAVSDLKAQAYAFAGGWKPEAIDPVCRMAMRIADAGGTERYQGREYYFCRMPHCREAFLKDPSRYLKDKQDL
jgi:YHS domain-containing protein